MFSLRIDDDLGKTVPRYLVHFYDEFDIIDTMIWCHIYDRASHKCRLEEIYRFFLRSLVLKRHVVKHCLYE